MKQTVLNLFRAAFIATLLAGPSLMLSSCGDETEGKASINDAAPAKVTEVSSVAGPGEVYLTWTIPSDPSYMYTKVTYKNAKGEEVYQMFSKDHADENGVVKATISGFVATDPVEFNLYACSLRGNNQGAVTYSAAPGAPAFLAVVSSITADPAWGGVKIGYSNETTVPVFINIDYSLKSDASTSGNLKFEAGAKSTSSKNVALGLPGDMFVNGETAVLSVTTQDAAGNASDVRTIEVRTKKVALIDRSDWTFPGYADSYDPQPGYDSQEAGGEGPLPKGRVIAMIDGNNGTFWHTRWKGATDKYPHFFVVDMGADKEVVAVGMRRRPGKDGVKTHKGQTFYTCSSAVASGSDPETWNWTDQGWNAFDTQLEDNQVFCFDKPGQARYIKAYFAETDKGTSDHAIVAEFNAYTPAE